jgi:hypothetical protein
VDAILVWRLDRWSRSLADLVLTLKELSELGVGFIRKTALGYRCKEKQCILSPATRVQYAGVTWQNEKRCFDGRCSLWIL